MTDQSLTVVEATTEVTVTPAATLVVAVTADGSTIVDTAHATVVESQAVIAVEVSAGGGGGGGGDPAGTAAALVATHEAEADPHPQYTTATEANAAAASAVVTHVAAGDPHPQYMTVAEGNAAYEGAGAVATHAAEANPHPQYATDADLAAHVAAADPHTGYATADELAAAITAHEASSDPHPEYMTQTEADARYPLASELSETVRDVIGAALVAGTNVTITPNDGGDTITIDATGGGGGAMTLVGTATVTGSAATTIGMSGLDLYADHTYVLEVALKNATASAASIFMYFNDDTAPANYYNQSISGNGSVNGQRLNTALITALIANGNATGEIKVRADLNGRARSYSTITRDESAIQMQMLGHVWTTVANVTSLTLSSSVANSIAIGSYIKLWKLN